MNIDRLPPLNSLKAFEAAARHESFLEAANEQGVTPGSISRHVRLLECHLGTELFVRRSNGVALTSAGRDYAGQVSAVFRDLKGATDRVRKPSRDRAIAISSLPIFSERWLYRRIPSFRKVFSRAELRVEAHNSEHDAKREDVDAWIFYSKGRHPGYNVTRLFGEEVFPVCSPQFRRTLSACPSADEVIGQPLLHDIYWDTDWPDWARAVGATVGEPAADMRFALYKGVIKAAVNGMGMAVGHGEMVAKELATGKLVPLEHLSVDSEKSYHLVMKPSSAGDRTLVRLKKWLLQECTGGRPSNG
ncbi:MAG: LysR family transcriptional regulator [Boseongicola sp. SB0664_bin_43]|uniref:LysR family transcriptional regulator n=1 Tax=Boseongicola sp. SB0664_bin_43 TaxID=2604844 RepID=A0A6B0XXT9_9RHOB|nr:LysR family transcriptional regulator [Boseongicola sp. SB0664_bin_43]